MLLSSETWTRSKTEEKMAKNWMITMAIVAGHTMFTSKSYERSTGDLNILKLFITCHISDFLQTHIYF